MDDDFGGSIAPALWETAFRFLDANQRTHNKWALALASLGGVSLSTLKRRYAKRYSGPTVKGPEPRLGGVAEANLVAWIEAQWAVGNCIPPAMLVKKAKQYGEFVGLPPNSVGGADWHRRFRARHPEVSRRLAQICGVERLLAASYENAERFYDLWEVAADGVLPQNMYFMDEMGLASHINDKHVSDAARAR